MPERELLEFTRQLRVLLQAGVPLLAGLDLIAQGNPPRHTLHLVRHLRRQMMAGRSLHAALRALPHMPRAYTHTIAAGEASGSLPQVLERLAEELSARLSLTRQLRAALTYPLVVLMIALVVLGVMMVWVIPAFEGMFSALGGQLPAATRWVLALSHGVTSQWPLVLGGLVLAVLALGMSWRHPQGRRLMLEGWWRVPGWGPLHRLGCQARWTRTLATLSAAGLPLTDALTHLDGIAGHPRFDTATRHIRHTLVQGQSLTRALARFGPQRVQRHAPELFSGMMLQMTHMGEESGSLDVLLERAAQQLEHDVAQRVGAVSRLVEPALMVVLGGLVGGLVIALYLPLFQLGQIL
jgi:type IV pilus assembly protein PilC